MPLTALLKLIKIDAQCVFAHAERARALILPTSKQSCSGENCRGWPSKGAGLSSIRANFRASSSRWPVPADPLQGHRPAAVRVAKHRPQAQHRARTPEYPNRWAESTNVMRLSSRFGCCFHRYSSETMTRLDKRGAHTKSLLIITGTMGAGKTTVLGEASDILAIRHIAHAAIDVDALGLAYLPSVSNNDGAMYRNLRSVCTNYDALGVQRFVLARAMEDRAQLDHCRDIIGATNTVVCRLTASVEAMEQRINIRESGIWQREYVARVATLNDILDRARLEDLTVTNEDRSLTDVALEMLIRAGWISN